MSHQQFRHEPDLAHALREAGLATQPKVRILPADRRDAALRINLMRVGTTPEKVAAEDARRRRAHSIAEEYQWARWDSDGALVLHSVLIRGYLRVTVGDAVFDLTHPDDRQTLVDYIDRTPGAAGRVVAS